MGCFFIFKGIDNYFNVRDLFDVFSSKYGILYFSAFSTVEIFFTAMDTGRMRVYFDNANNTN